MTDPYVATIPLIGRLSSIVSWLLLVNVLLVGTVILLAYKIIVLRERISELEDCHETQGTRDANPLSGARSQHEILADDKPIPIVR